MLQQEILKIPQRNHMENIKLINITLIDRPENPMRLQFNEEDIQALTSSIQAQGVLVPLLVRANGERYEVIDGDSRLEACHRLRIGEVSCVVRNATDSETIVLRMLANLDRSDPDPVSEAVCIARAIETGTITAEELTQKLNKTSDWVENRLAIADMPDYMQNAIRTKVLGLGVALLLAQIDNDTTRRQWMNSAIVSGMTVRGARDALFEYQKYKALAEGMKEGEEPPPLLTTPPIVLYPCARCGKNDKYEVLKVVRIHQIECEP